VTSIVRADTLEVRLADGRRQPGRVLGVSAPRSGDCGVSRATAEVRRLAAGKRVTLADDAAAAPGASYVVLPGGRDLGRLLVANGYAQIDPLDQRFARFATYVPAQRTAEQAKRGIWGSCAADLSVAIEAPTDDVVVGTEAGYTVSVRNAGPLRAANGTLELRASDGTSLVAAASSEGACTAGGWVATCAFASIPAGGAVSVVVRLRADTAGLAPLRAWGSFLGCVAAHCGMRALNDSDLLNDRTAALVTAETTQPTAPSPPASPTGPAAPSGPAPPPPTNRGCEPSYPTVCIPPPPPYLICYDIPFRAFPVSYAVPNPDPHDFDRDDDGYGCEADDY
jgi:Domain of unknown function DUF11